MAGVSSVTSEELMRECEGQTLPKAFLKIVSDRGDAIALRWKRDDDSWAEWTWREYADRVARAVGGLKAQGVGSGDRIVLMLRNMPDFHVLDVAATFCGAASVSIYNSSSSDQVRYLVDHCGASVAIVEGPDFLDRFLAVRDDLSSLRALVCLALTSDTGVGSSNHVIAGRAILDYAPVDLEAIVDDCRPDDLATLIYTSGTTGPPKAVTITHRNIAWTVASLVRCINFESYAGKRLVSYLPMAHIAERMTSHYQQVFLGYEITTCPVPGEISTYLRAVRPNLFFGVPRVWEKIHGGVVAALAADPERKALFESAVEASDPIREAMAWDQATDEQLATWEFLDESGFHSIRDMMGLDQCEIAISGAAPIPAGLIRWFQAIGVPLSEIYGMSENSGPMTWEPWQIKPGTVGRAIPGCEVKLADDGEVLCRGGNVFGGYLADPEKTAEALDADGWLHSGDIGEIDSDGYVRIVDRKKELIITAGGKNISPANLEASLKAIPLVGQAMAIGDDRPFVSALVVLDPEFAPAWATAQRIEFSSLEDLATNADVVAEIESGLITVMEQFNNAERVKRVTVLGQEWMPDTDLLTPTSKLKRRGILAQFSAEIEAMYS
ncbi:MAG: long-chain fatty acid--CoA ligase [Actinomycetes bacterium]